MPVRRFWARFFAMMIDFILIAVIVQAVIYLLIGGGLGTYRMNSGLLTMTSCQPGIPSGPNGEKLDLSNWQSSTICNVRSLPFARDRYMIVRRTEKREIGNYTEKVTLRIDGKGRLVDVVDLDFIIVFIVVLISALMEASSWQRTPGKWVFALLVTDKIGGVLQFTTALKRNFIRFSPLMLLSIPNILMSNMLVKNLLVGDKIVFTFFPVRDFIVFFAIYTGVAIVIYGSMLVPWKRRGVGLHNMLANAVVVEGQR